MSNKSDDLANIRELLLDARRERNGNRWFTGVGTGLAVAGAGLGLADASGPGPSLVVVGALGLALGLVFRI